jgi:fructose/tagatose bisphosphate aldolase
MNLRVLSFDAARAVFRVANQMNAGAFIFEIARSEIGYTDQKPAEYTTNILAAAIAEDWRGPVFIQGDHFQLRPKVSAIQSGSKRCGNLQEANAASFYNIGAGPRRRRCLTMPEQQATNVRLSSDCSPHPKPPASGLTISVGSEIGEVRATARPANQTFMDGFNAAMKASAPGKPGLSKISIQTGTAHGGTVLPNGSLASVNIDFRTLKELSRLGREAYGLGGAVQHGASTLPEEAFHKFVEYEALRCTGD